MTKKEIQNQRKKKTRVALGKDRRSFPQDSDTHPVTWREKEKKVGKTEEGGKKDFFDSGGYGRSDINQNGGGGRYPSVSQKKGRLRQLKLSKRGGRHA